MPTRPITTFTMFGLLIASLLAGGGAGCGGGTTTKPIPVIYGPGRADATANIPETKRTNNIPVFYATNRVGKGPADDRKYTNKVDDKLHLGVASVRMGDKKTSWDDIARASNGQGGNLAFKYAGARELGIMRDASDEAFVQAINQQLQSTKNREVNIYVHGYRTNLPMEAEVLAKLLHFSRRGGAMVCFAWPARQNLLLYSGDVERARKSAVYLADLIDLIAGRTDAERINVLGYSAGAEATAAGLCELRNRYPKSDAEGLGKRMHIGNVIFAASDLDLKVFARDQLNRIQDLGENTVIYIAKNDAALGIASLGFKASRLGRPDVTKLNLNKEQIEQAAKDTSLQVVDVTNVPGPHAAAGGFGGHGYWYANDRIMTDLLVILRWQIPAAERGLVQKPGAARWYFPKDYSQRVYAAVKRLAEQPTTAPATTNPVTASSSGGGGGR